MVINANQDILPMGNSDGLPVLFPSMVRFCGAKFCGGGYVVYTGWRHLKILSEYLGGHSYLVSKAIQWASTFGFLASK